MRLFSCVIVAEFQGRLSKTGLGRNHVLPIIRLTVLRDTNCRIRQRITVVTQGSTSTSLSERVRNRDREAWYRLYYLYAPLVHHWCHGWGIQGPDTEDIKQEVFQAVASGVEVFCRDRPDDTFRGWLRVITYRKFLDHHRRQEDQPQAQGGSSALRRLQQVPEPNLAEDAPEQVRQLHQRALELVRGEFEERTWQAFWRTGVESQAPADVAHDMGMTATAVHQAKSRVLRRLKEELGDLLT